MVLLMIISVTVSQLLVLMLMLYSFYTSIKHASLLSKIDFSKLFLDCFNCEHISHVTQIMLSSPHVNSAELVQRIKDCWSSASKIVSQCFICFINRRGRDCQAVVVSTVLTE